MLVKKISLSDLLELPVSERLRLVHDLWDSIAELPEALQLTDEQKSELDKRLEQHRLNPDAAIPWDEVKKNIGL